MPVPSKRTEPGSGTCWAFRNVVPEYVAWVPLAIAIISRWVKAKGEVGEDATSPEFAAQAKVGVPLLMQVAVVAVEVPPGMMKSFVLRNQT